MSTVLVVDDLIVDRHLAGGLLEKSSNLDVVYAGNGAEALVIIKRDPPDLVLTDLMMPEVDGFELVAAVVSQYPLIPVILMTGAGSEETAVRALQAGAASYVPKSELAELLLETVENVLEAAREERSECRLMDCMTSSQSVFVLSNDSTMIPPLINYVHRAIRAVGLVDEANGIRVCVALEEALNNALFHGNLEISSELRTHDADTYRKLITERSKSSPFQERSISVVAHITRADAKFIVRDEGPGFDPHGLPDPTDPANLEKASGRGLLLMRTFMDSVSFNDLGNEVTMVKTAVRDPAHADAK